MPVNHQPGYGELASYQGPVGLPARGQRLCEGRTSGICLSGKSRWRQNHLLALQVMEPALPDLASCCYSELRSQIGPRPGPVIARANTATASQDKGANK